MTRPITGGVEDMAAAVAWSWENVLGVVASILQILGVDVALLLLLVAGALGLSSCKQEYGELTRRTSELEALARLPTGQGAERVLRQAGLWEEVVLAIRAANDLVEAYDRSSVFHVVRHSRSMQRDMALARRHVSNCYEIAVRVHADVAAVGSCV